MDKNYCSTHSVNVHRVTTSRLDIGWCLLMLRYELCYYPPLIVYMAHDEWLRHALFSTLPLSGYEWISAANCKKKRQQMIESYLSDADTTSEQKLPIIDQFFT